MCSRWWTYFQTVDFVDEHYFISIQIQAMKSHGWYLILKLGRRNDLRID
jgi:hypothetical protein